MDLEADLMPPFIIPIFIQHQGCPHRCIFCDQHRIAGVGAKVDNLPDKLGVQKVIAAHLHWPHHSNKVEVAFYGGSFTGLPQARQLELLAAVKPYLDSGEVDSIRLSTRPDYITPAIAQFLLAHGVRLVEIGVQSMEARVLAASLRGHSAADVEAAFLCLQQAGLDAGAQLMVGLPAETSAGIIAGAKRVAEFSPACVRIYPVLVIKGSGLERLYRNGQYQELSPLRTLALVSRIKGIFDSHRIKVIRMGLQATDNLAESIVAGPYYPAFGEMVYGRQLFKKARKALAATRNATKRRLLIATRDESIFRGRRNISLRRLTDLGLLTDVELVFAPDQPRHTVAVEVIDSRL